MLKLKFIKFVSALRVSEEMDSSLAEVSLLVIVHYNSLSESLVCPLPNISNIPIQCDRCHTLIDENMLRF